ncbi:hypothetical protein [Streptomyces sp. NPDC051286]|uniref:hypothetical protein n=1 Tax=Streptomyces sp. NPDC051286 TaxID=3365647 RepID=UPI00379C6CA8
MIYLAEASDMQILARFIGVTLTGIGPIGIILAVLTPKVVREEREKGNLETAAKVRRSGWGAATIGISLIGIGACLYFFS